MTLVAYVTTRGLDDAITDAQQLQASTAALIALLMSATWVLSTVARPYVWWRAGLVIFAYSFYFSLFLFDFSRRWLYLDVSDRETMLVGIVLGAIGMVAVEAAWWISAAIRGDKPRLLPSRERVEAVGG